MENEEKKFLGLIPMKYVAPVVMNVLAIAAVIASGYSTFDISYSLSPRQFALTVAIATVLVVDIGFLALDFIFPYVKTSTARTLVAFFMAILWVAMVGTNIADAIFNKTFDASELGWASWIMYAVKVMGLLYLAMYAYIRFDDPDTKKILQQTEIEEIKSNELLIREKEYSKLVSVPYAKALAIQNIENKFKREHNKNIADVLGRDWVKTYLPETVEREVPVEEPVAPAVPARAARNASKSTVAQDVPPIPDDQGMLGKLLGAMQNAKNPTIPQTRKE